MDEPLLTVQQVAVLLNVHPWTVRRYVHSGLLAHFRLPGGGFRFKRDDVAAVLKEE